MRLFSPDEKYLPQIKTMCASCFDMEIEEVEYVFEQKYISTRICYAIEDEGKICCMLFTVPCKLAVEGELRKGHYIYGACTLPEYRHRGLMHRLVEYANAQTAEKCDEFSVCCLQARHCMILQRYGLPCVVYSTKRGYKQGIFTTAECRGCLQQ